MVLEFEAIVSRTEGKYAFSQDHKKQNKPFTSKYFYGIMQEKQIGEACLFFKRRIRHEHL